MSSTRKIIPIVVTVVVLAIAGLFVFRVLTLYNQIQSGELTTNEFEFTDSVTLSPRLAQAVTRPDPEQVFDVYDDDDPSLGNPDAVLTIVEFADFGCPFSREASFAIRALALTYADRIQYIYRDFPISELHPEAQMAAEAGQCAHEQDPDKFWAFHDLMYQNQLDLSRPSIRNYAGAVGLDASKLDNCLASGRYRGEVLTDYQDGIDAGVVGTPTFFFNGQRVPGSIPVDTLQAIIEAFL